MNKNVYCPLALAVVMLPSSVRYCLSFLPLSVPHECFIIIQIRSLKKRSVLFSFSAPFALHFCLQCCAFER